MLEPLASIIFYGRWVIGSVAGVVGASCIGFNWWLVIQGLIRPRLYAESMVPIAGGLAAAAAMLIIPVGAIHKWAWTPLVADLACAPLIVGLLVESVRGGLRRNVPTK